MIIVFLPSEPTPAERAASVFAPFAALVHERVSDIERVDLHRETEEPRQSLCGEHGYVTPSPQGVCRWCAGYVESGESVVRIRETAAALKAIGVYDRDHVGYIRMRPHYNPRPGC